MLSSMTLTFVVIFLKSRQIQCTNIDIVMIKKVTDYPVFTCSTLGDPAYSAMPDSGYR